MLSFFILKMTLVRTKNNIINLDAVNTQLGPIRNRKFLTLFLLKI